MGNEVIYLCPFCTDHKGHLYVNYDKNVFNCFKCGMRGKLADIPLEKWESLQVVRSIEDAELPAIESTELPGYRLDTYEGVMRDVPLQYLRSRNVSFADVCRYGLRYSPDIGAIWFPIYSVPGSGIPLWWQAKIIGDGYMSQKTKLINFTLFRTFGIPYLTKPKELVILTEGVFDALSVSRVLPAVAGFGKNIPNGRLEMLRHLADNVCVLLDKDAESEGVETTLRLRSLGIRAWKGDSSKLNKDPGDSTPGQIWDAVMATQPFGDERTVHYLD